jgi:hypothetical protein
VRSPHGRPQAPRARTPRAPMPASSPTTPPQRCDGRRVEGAKARACCSIVGRCLGLMETQPPWLPALCRRCCISVVRAFGI